MGSKHPMSLCLKLTNNSREAGDKKTIMVQLQPFYSAIKRLQPISTIEIFISSLDLAEIQRITREELKNKSGIYGFLSKTTGKLYIGSSINLSDRFSEHIKGSRSNILLQRAINKY